MEWLIERLISLIPLLAKYSKEKRDIADNALIAVSTALAETSLYLAHIRQGGKAERAREEQLARYWAAAAVPVRHLDEEFADICQYKSDVWVSPDSWDPEKIGQYRIDLDSVRKRYTELLHTA